MNKTLVLVFFFLAIALIAHNVTLVDFDNPLQGDSTVALIGIMASLCGMVLLLIFMASKKIDKKLKDN